MKTRRQRALLAHQSEAGIKWLSERGLSAIAGNRKLAAAAGPAAGVSDGVWSWVKTDGSVGGTALAAGAPWLVHFTFANPSGNDDTGQLRAAMTGGSDLTADGTPGTAPDPRSDQCLFDLQASQLVPSRYVVEYESTAAVTSVVR